LLDQTLSSGTAAVAIIRAALRQAMRLHEMRCAVGKGAADAAAMIQGWRPPVHFRSRKAVAQALALWSESGLAETITILLDAEVALKTGRPDLAVCRRAIQGLGRPR
jgi:DNA polymerase III delta subunit